MKLEEIKREIERIIAGTPLSRDEVFSILKAEPELPTDELFAYAVALGLTRDKKSRDYKKLQREFLKKRDELMQKYGVK